MAEQASQRPGCGGTGPPRAAAGRVLAGRALAALFASGATLAVLGNLVPHGHRVDSTAAVLTGLVGFPVAFLLFRFAARIPGRLLHVVLAAGTGMVSLGVWDGHGSGPGVASAFFYVWVALYAFYFFSWRAAVAQLALAAVAYAVVLTQTGGAGLPAQWVFVMGTALTSGVVIGLVSRELVRLATTDELTGLANRRSVEEALRREVARACRHQRPLAVVLVDLDDFKAVNDTGGHAAGDRMLAELAHTWQSRLRSVDLLGRYGGDEFVAVLPDTSADQAATLLARLGGPPFSAGVAELCRGEETERLLSRADAALYRAKQAGKGRVHLAETASG